MAKSVASEKWQTRKVDAYALSTTTKARQTIEVRGRKCKNILLWLTDMSENS